MSVSVNIKNANTISRKVSDCSRSLEKRKASFAMAVIIVDRWIQKNFASEGAPVGGWAPLKPLTIARRREGKKKNKGHRILQDAGQLKTRWKHYWTDRSAIVRSGVDYGIYHDSDKPRTVLPRRQILPDEKHIIRDIEKIFGKHVSTSIERADLD